MGLLKWCSCLKKNQMEDVRILDFSHSHLVDVPPDVFQYERTLEELHLEANRVSETGAFVSTSDLKFTTYFDCLPDHRVAAATILLPGLEGALLER